MSRTTTTAEALMDLLGELGTEHVLGISGGAVVPIHAAAADHRDLRFWHTRSEAGAGFAATELSLHTGRPVALFVTTGPGVTNAITGLAAAKSEGAHVVLISGVTGAAHRGRWGCQETTATTLPAGLFSPGFFDLATIVEHPAQLGAIRARLAAGFRRPQGFVAHLSVPLGVQTAPCALPPTERRWATPGAADEDTLRAVADTLREGPVAIWVGYGARGCAESVLALAEVLDARVMCTPRGKGVFPEDHPRFLGVTGLGGHARVADELGVLRPRHTLVLGTRMGELSSFWSEALEPSGSFVQVDADPDVLGAAYPHVPTVAVVGELRATTARLAALLGARPASREPAARALSSPTPRAGRVRPSWLFDRLQRVVVEGSDAVVMTEAGNALAWGNHALRFDRPGRYRVSCQFGAMGHFACGVVGPAMAGQRAVAVVGDGAMLMTNELSTAVAHGLPAIWVVLDDGQYGMIEHGMRAQGFVPAQTALPTTDFAALARAQGATGLRVEREDEVDNALRAALAHPGPVVIDVVIDPTEPSPFLARTLSLVRQGGGGRVCVPGGAA